MHSFLAASTWHTERVIQCGSNAATPNTHRACHEPLEPPHLQLAVDEVQVIWSQPDLVAGTGRDAQEIEVI